MLSSALLLGSLVAGSIAAQDAAADLNARYAYPFSAGVGAVPTSLLYDAQGAFSVNEVSGFARLTLPGVPWLGPTVRGGAIWYDSLDTSAPTKWDAVSWFAGPGVSVQSRISKAFEIGGELFVAPALTTYPSLVTDADGNAVETQTWNAIAGAGLKLTLNPSYNFSIDVAPSIRYQLNLGGMIPGYSKLDRFDGASFGVGFSVNYRIGTDPDAPQAEIRAIRFSDVEMPPMFASMQSVYARHAFTTIELANSQSGDVENLEVAFYQAGYMDSPTFSPRIDVVPAGQTVEVPLYASFNREVFSTIGVTPMVAEVIARYTYRGRPVEQRTSLAYDLYDRNAMTWDDNRKIAAFVTPSDSAIRNYASYIRSTARDDTNAFVSSGLQFAFQTYGALAAQGLLYQIDPGTPFASAQGNSFVVDSVSLPRETISRITGDCDDMSVLFNTILEAGGVETAFVTIPGHIYVAINTGVPANQYALVNPNRELLIIVDGEIWVPIEITLVGRAPVLEAWETGAREWYAHDAHPDSRGFYPTRVAQETYRPVGLVETDLGLQYAGAGAIRDSFVDQYRKLTSLILDPELKSAQSDGSARSWNRYGVLAAQVGRYDAARTAFTNAARADAQDVRPAVNLGSIQYLEGDFGAAFASFREALRRIDLLRRTRDSLRATTYLNLAKTAYQLEDFTEARDYYRQAQELDPEEASSLAYIAADDGARASDAAAGPPIYFADSDEDE